MVQDCMNFVVYSVGMYEFAYQEMCIHIWAHTDGLGRVRGGGEGLITIHPDPDRTVSC
jgi:hypothetical protein